MFEELFCIFTVRLVTEVHTLVIAHKNINLKWVQFCKGKLYLNKVYFLKVSKKFLIKEIKSTDKFFESIFFFFFFLFLKLNLESNRVTRE